jgi:hypothetical protein
VLARFGDHRLEQAAIRLLRLASPAQLGLSLSEPHRETVSDALQLGHAEHSRATHGGHAPVDPLPGKRRGEQLAELALEGADLAPKLDPNAPLRELVRPLVAKERVQCPGRRRGIRRLDLQQFVGHEASLRSRRPVHSSRSSGAGWELLTRCAVAPAR